jgi:hypothetical protein
VATLLFELHLAKVKAACLSRLTRLSGARFEDENEDDGFELCLKRFCRPGRSSVKCAINPEDSAALVADGRT